MKDFVKFFSVITGLFRSVISIVLLFALGFVVFVDTRLLYAFFDIIGINSINIGIIKPVSLVLIGFAFIINTIVSRNIFRAGDDGKSHPVNIFFALVFLAIDLLLLVSFREKLIFILIGLNGLLLLNSFIGLAAKLKGLYKDHPTKKTEYIEVGSLDKENKDLAKDKSIKIGFKDDKSLIKKDESKLGDQTESKSTRLITKETPKNEETTKISLADRREVSDKSDTLTKDKDSKEDDFEIRQTKAKNEDGEKSEVKKVKDTNGEKEVQKASPNKTNKVIENQSPDKTYGEDLANKIKDEEERKIYSKDKFLKNPKKEE